MWTTPWSGCESEDLLNSLSCDGPGEPQGQKSPNKIKEPKSSSKVGFREILKIGQKVGPEVGFPEKEKMKTYFWTYFLT